MDNSEGVYVAINRDLTITIPDPDTIKRIINKYSNYSVDFLESKNRYAYLYKIMYYIVKDIEDAD